MVNRILMKVVGLCVKVSRIVESVVIVCLSCVCVSECNCLIYVMLISVVSIILK